MSIKVQILKYTNVGGETGSSEEMDDDTIHQNVHYKFMDSIKSR